jgi:hypothetical protein
MAEVSASSIVQIFSALGKISDVPRSFACSIYQDRLSRWGAHLHAILPKFCTLPDCARIRVREQFQRRKRRETSGQRRFDTYSHRNDCTVSCHKAVDGIRK